MNERFVAELIEDLDHMRQLLDRCVRKLRTVVPNVGDDKTAFTAPAIPVSVGHNDIRAEIERQRQEIIAQVEQVKAQAMSTIASARSGALASGAGANMPGLGMGMTGLSGLESLGSEKMKELQQKIAEMAESKK